MVLMNQSLMATSIPYYVHGESCSRVIDMFRLMYIHSFEVFKWRPCQIAITVWQSPSSNGFRLQCFLQLQADGSQKTVYTKPAAAGGVACSSTRLSRSCKRITVHFPIFQPCSSISAVRMNASCFLGEPFSGKDLSNHNLGLRLANVQYLCMHPCLPQLSISTLIFLLRI